METSKEYCICPMYGFVAWGYALTCLLLVIVFHSCGKYIVNIFSLSDSSFLPMVPELLHIQHSPSSRMQSKWSCKMFHLTIWKGFCEYIGSHIFCRTVYQIDSSILYYKTNEMIPYVNVLCLGMIWSIFGECNSRLWVLIQHCRLSNRSKRFSYDLSKPQGFLWSISSGYIFRFSCRWCNKFLFLRWPWNCTSFHEKNIPWDCMPMLLWWAICICISFQTVVCSSICQFPVLGF